MKLMLAANYVPIEAHEVALCQFIGRARTHANMDKPNAAEYDEGTMLDDLEGNTMGALCELAVSKFTGERWTSMGAWSKADHDKFKHLPDAGDDIEVRMIVTGPGPKIKDDETDGYLFCVMLEGNTVYTTEAEMVGWISMREAHQVKQPHPKRNYHYVPKSALHSPSSWPRKVRVQKAEWVRDAMNGGNFVVPDSPVYEVEE